MSQAQTTERMRSAATRAETRAPSTTSDEQLAHDAQQGDREAFARLVRRHQSAIVNYVYRMIGDYELALDLSQEVFTRAYLAIDRFNPRYRFTTWLYRIASNRTIDELRRRRPVLLPIDPDSGDTTRADGGRSPAPDPEEEYRSTELREVLDRLIAELPASYRELVLLRHLNQCSYEEMAAICRLPLGTVKNRLFRARNLLRRGLEQAVGSAP